jgi:hypothetical protein
METAFQAELDQWEAYFGFVGTGAVTLAALLFVAVSLRLNIFRDENVADVKDFARLTLFCFLAPMVISGVALMPHEQPLAVAIPLFVLSVVGVAASMLIAREWVKLSQAGPIENRGFQPGQWKAWVYGGIVALAYLALSVAAVMLLAGSGIAFVFLAAVEGWLLLTGTVNAWIMLTNAGGT